MELKLETLMRIHDHLLTAHDAYNTEEEKDDVVELMNLLAFGEEFMESEDKGTLKEYEE